MAIEYGIERTDVNHALSLITVDDGVLVNSSVKLGRRVSNTSDLVIASAPAALPSTAKFRSGFALDANDCIYATETEPTTKLYSFGVATRTDGAVWVTNSYVAPMKEIYHPLIGFALVNQSGALYGGILMGVAFSDLGAGEVDLTGFLSGAPTFTRATVASTVGSTGLIVDVASGVPRSRYDPVTLEYQGFFSELAATNVILQSENFGTTWTAIGTPTRTSTAVTCGTVVLDLLGDDSATVLEGYQQTATLTGNAVKTVSLFYKEGTSASSMIRLRDTDAPADRLLAAITWSGGVPTVTMTTGTLNSNVGPFGASGVYRAEMLTTSATATNVNILQVYPAAVADLGITPTGTLNVGGVMVQNSIFGVASYIKTTTAAVTRNADVLSYPFTANGSGTEGACYAELATLYPATNTSGGTSAAVTFGTTNLGHPLAIASTQAVTAIVCTDSTASASKTGLTSMFTAVRKRASSWGAAGQIITGDGAAVATAAFDGTMGETLTAIKVGCGNTGNQWNGTIKNFKVWTTQRNNIVALTA